MSQNPPALKEAHTSEPSGSFVSTLAALKNGQLITELDDALREVTQAVADTKLKGVVTLTIEIAPGGVGLGETPLYRITPDIGQKIPKKPESSQVFFTDEHFNLTRRSPNQTEDTRLTVVSDGKPAGVSRAKAVNS